MRVRTLDEEDVDFAVAQAAREGWAATGLWFELILALDREGSFVVEDDGVRAGFVTTTCYEKTAWVGNLIVPPALRRRGLGTGLMTRALDHIEATGIRTVRLDADPPGINIYRRLGFVEQFESLRFRLDAPRLFPVTCAVAMKAAHLEVVNRLDRGAFGDDRSRLLRGLFDHAEAAFVVERGDRVSGFAFAIATTAGMHVGPMAAEDESVARDLWGAALRAARGRPISAGIPAPNRAGSDVLRSLGFTARPSSVRMVWGRVGAESAIDRVFAVGSGAFG